MNQSYLCLLLLCILLFFPDPTKETLREFCTSGLGYHISLIMDTYHAQYSQYIMDTQKKEGESKLIN